MHKFIPLSAPNLKGRELEYVTEAIQTEWVSTGGPHIQKFENQIAQYVHATGAVACQSGTAGIHIALQLCGVERDNEVIVPALTFIAAVNPVKYLGAEPVFMDCDDSLCIDPDKLLAFCENECAFDRDRLINKRTERTIKAIVVVHVFGNMADMVRINEIAKRFHFKVVEDATEAIGTYYTSGIYKGKFAGCIGDVGVYSFNGNKIITTGGGGMIISQDKGLLDRARHLTTQAKSDDVYYTHDEVGYNYRMTNLQASVGIAQLEQLETFIAIKRKNYDLYSELLADQQGLSILGFRQDIRSNYWFYSLFCNENYPLNRDEIIQFLASHNVQSRPIWGIINEQLPYKHSQTYQIEKARTYINNVVNIPCSTNLHEDDIRYIVGLLMK